MCFCNIHGGFLKWWEKVVIIGTIPARKTDIWLRKMVLVFHIRILYNDYVK